MFRRRRRHGLSLGNIIGLVFAVIGISILLYVIPFKFWIFIFGCSCVFVGIFIFNL